MFSSLGLCRKVCKNYTKKAWKIDPDSSIFRRFLLNFDDCGLKLHPEVEESRLGETRRAEESRKYGFSLDFECQMAAPGLNEQFQAANS